MIITEYSEYNSIYISEIARFQDHLLRLNILPKYIVDLLQHTLQALKIDELKNEWLLK